MAFIRVIVTGSLRLFGRRRRRSFRSTSYGWAAALEAFDVGAQAGAALARGDVLGAIRILLRFDHRITRRRLRELRRASRRAAVEISRNLQAALKAAAPVRTGRLKRSIRTSAVRDIGRRIEIDAETGIHVRMRFYGWIQNNGSGRNIRHSGWIDRVVDSVATPAHYAAATRRHLRWSRR